MGIFQKPSIKSLGKKRDMPEGLWQKCPSCREVIHDLESKQQLRVCPTCGQHFTQSASERLEMLADESSFEEILPNAETEDILRFKTYRDRLKKYQRATGMKEAVISGSCKIGGIECTIAVMDFRFLAASMGAVAGEKITLAIETATERRLPVIIVAASGGARMYEGMLSLMQMAKTSGALALHSKAGLPYISVLTHPTTGGVTASFATLGDIIIAEPKCMIGFAGPRVVKETTHQELPPGFQTAEFMMKHGLVDMIVPRSRQKTTITRLLSYLVGAPVEPEGEAEPEPDTEPEVEPESKSKPEPEPEPEPGREPQAEADAPEEPNQDQESESASGMEDETAVEPEPDPVDPPPSKPEADAESKA